MSDNLVRVTVDLDHPEPLTGAQREQLERLAAMRDDDIDLSDIPEVDFSNAIPFRDRHLYRPLKDPMPVPIDADVLGWLRTKTMNYEARVNAILREAMSRDQG